jgi:hypothetical protein
LGYESSDKWTRELPKDANSELDRGRIRVRSSAIYAFENRWLDDDSLQRQFPLPHDHFGCDSYFEWLSASSEPAIVDWFQRIQSLTLEWGYVRDDVRHDADRRLGF